MRYFSRARLIFIAIVLVLGTVLAIETSATESFPGLTFHPLPHCRVYDSRHIPGCEISPTTGGCEGFENGDVAQVDFYLADNTPQGGEAHSCGVPASAEAVAIHVTAAEAYGPGHIRAWALGEDEPLPPILNYSLEYGYSNTGAIVRLGMGTANFKVSFSETHVVIDVQGYYGP